MAWLCRNVLNYTLIDDQIHGPLINRLQKFPTPSREDFEKNDVLLGRTWHYTPIKPMLQLDGRRRKLILDSRSIFKSTLNSIAHTIQWIINYPEISVLILMAAEQRASDILGEIKAHFQYNGKFRELFPEHCPQKAPNDFGTQGRFTTLARPPEVIRKEPTVMTASVDKGAASYHFHVMKFSDIVDENNIVGDGINRITSKFDISHNLLIDERYWIDVEGTRYTNNDTYGTIIEREGLLKPEEREYDIYCRGIYVRDVPGGELFTPDETKKPFKLDEKGDRISRWPERYSLRGLERREQDDPFIFSAQLLNAPNSTGASGPPFPVNDTFPVWITRESYEKNIRIAYKEICVDFAETDNPRSNYTCITVGAVDSGGRLYIDEIHWGRFLADEAVRILFETALKHYRHLRSIKMEDVAYTRGLMPTIQRALELQYRPNGIDFIIETIKRGNRTSKKDRIHKSIQPWYKKSDLRFLDDITVSAKRHLLKELEEFPSSATDDILDTIADFLTDKEYFGREASRGNPLIIQRDYKTGLINDPAGINRVFKHVQDEAMTKWLRIGFDDNNEPAGVNRNYI